MTNVKSNDKCQMIAPYRKTSNVRRRPYEYLDQTLCIPFDGPGNRDLSKLSRVRGWFSALVVTKNRFGSLAVIAMGQSRQARGIFASATGAED